jgi:hypothetical protein
MPKSTNGPDIMVVRHEAPAPGVAPDLRDAIVGRTGNRGIEVHARQLDAWQAVSYAEFSGASTARELEAAATTAEGGGKS